MAERFSGKSVLVAGGTGALGRVVSLAFLEELAKVIVTYQREEEFFALKTAAGAHASSHEGYQVDITDQRAVRQLAEGVFRMALNLRAEYVLSRAVVPVMLKQGSGAIVNVASQAALDHAAGAAAYAASKAGAVAMIDSLAADLKGTGVRANSILPNIIDTDANRRAMPNADFAKWPKPEDIARVILFLCSDDAKLINGAAIPVYGNA